MGGSILSPVSAWTASYFEAADGKTKDTVVTAQMVATLVDSGGSSIISAQVTDDFKISVTNEPETIDAGGTGSGSVK